MIRLDSLPVQEALRALLPELSQGPFAEELRQGLLAALTVAPGDGGRAELFAASAKSVEPAAQSTLGQAKLEFKFRRENTQELTVFFIDIVDYTGISSRLESSALLRLIKAFEDIVASTIAANRGTLVKKMGDAILAVFKHPLNATLAALGVQQKINEYSAMRMEQEKFQARVGLNTGRVTRKDNDIFGPIVNIAARMQSAADPGKILLTEATHKEVRDYVRCTELGKIQVKGVPEAITAYLPEEVIVDLSKLAETGAGSGKEKGALRDPTLEKLKESIFNPNFTIPPDKGAVGEIAGLLKGIFSEISRAIEEIASDYHEEYAFKQYLQEKWDTLMGSL
jgi:class 3 adenylate cyclase